MAPKKTQQNALTSPVGNTNTLRTKGSRSFVALPPQVKNPETTEYPTNNAHIAKNQVVDAAEFAV